MEIEANDLTGVYDLPLPGGICPDCFKDKRHTMVYLKGKLAGRLVISYCEHHKTGGTIILGATPARWTMMSPLTREEFLDAAVEFAVLDVNGANAIN